MKVKITSAKKIKIEWPVWYGKKVGDHYEIPIWYNNRIGEVFEVEPSNHNKNKYCVVDKVNGFYVSIWAEDCEIIEK